MTDTGVVGVKPPKIPYWQLPRTDWKPPTTFPSLRDAKVIVVDVESHDPDLRSKGQGPGYLRGNAYILGVAIKARWSNGETFKGYYPIRHCEGNLDPEHVFQYCRDNLQTDVPKAGANLPYDLEALWIDGKCKMTGPLWDIQNAEGILDEESARVTDMSHRGFRLDKLGQKYCGIGKQEDILDRLGVKDIKKWLKELPPSAVAAYAEGDVELTLDVLDQQLAEIQKQDLSEVWQLECDILPYLMEMRYAGVRVDPEKAKNVYETLKKEHDVLLNELKDIAGLGRHMDPDKREDLEALCKRIGVEPRYTAPSERHPDGQPSFTAPWLKTQTHPAFQKITACRQIEKMYRDFVEGVILGESIGTANNKRIHSQFHQLKRSTGTDALDEEEQGTRSGRFSSTNPNLQQIPKRDKRFGPLIRGMFLPDEGGEWFSGDYNSQEFRWLIQYAGSSAEMGALEPDAAKAALAMVEEYRRKPETDYHQKVADMTALARAIAKQMNLSLVYGAGQRKVAVNAGWITVDEFHDMEFKLPDKVKQFFTDYHAGVPFVSALLKLTDKWAQRRGWVKTFFGRKRHFDLWIPKTQRNRDSDWSMQPLPLAVAEHEWPGIPLVRADTRKALNSIIQGSAADQGKIALRTLGRAGLIPQIMVHDEFNRTVYEPSQAQTIHHAMVNAIELLIPVLVDCKAGVNWADATEDRAKELLAA